VLAALSQEKMGVMSIALKFREDKQQDTEAGSAAALEPRNP